MSVIQLPYKYETRAYQQAFWDAMCEIDILPSGEIKVTLLKDRAFLLWHRRSGKDLTFINWLTMMAFYHRIGTYWYMFPFLNQAKKVVWDGMDDMGRKFMDYFPPGLIYDTNETELQIILRHPNDPSKPGSILQLMGADKFAKSGVGPNPVGVAFSEYAVNAKCELAWHYVMPMLRQNGGWAVFLTTPRGKNHAYQLWKIAQQQPDVWFTSLQTVEQTRRDSDFDKVNPMFPYRSPVMSDEMIQADRNDGMTEETVQQEYYCSFNAPTVGAYFAKQLQLLRTQGRITTCPWEPSLGVETWWDIGHTDSTAIWFVQKLFREVRCIDFYHNRLHPFSHYANVLREGHRGLYVYNRHLGPHDLSVKEYFANKTRVETAREFGINFQIQPKISDKEDGIHFARQLLPRCIFDAERCEYGIDALETYHCEYDEETKVLGDKPEHDWSSDPSEAFILGASADSTGRHAGVHGTDRGPRPAYAVMNHDIRRRTR